MAITLDTLTLPASAVWQDELEWFAVVGTMEQSINGKLFIQETQVQESGRPITLGSDEAWMSRADVLTLQSWAGEAGKRMTLTLHDGTSRIVAFRVPDSPVVSVSPVVNYANPGGTAKYILNALKLVVV